MSVDKELYNRFARLTDVNDDIVEYFKAAKQVMKQSETNLPRFFHNFLLPGLTDDGTTPFDENFEVTEEERNTLIMDMSAGVERVEECLEDIDINPGLDEDEGSGAPIMIDTVGEDVGVSSSAVATLENERAAGFDTGMISQRLFQRRTQSTLTLPTYRTLLRQL